MYSVFRLRKTTRLTATDSAAPCDAAPHVRKARDTAGGSRKGTEKDREGEWKGGSSFGNSGTELVDESVGGYRRLSRRRATSNTEQEGSREEKRETNDGGGGGEPARRIERQDRDERRRGKENERRKERERENTFPASI